MNYPTPSSLANDPVAEATWNRLTTSFKQHHKPNQVQLHSCERYCHYCSMYEQARQDVATNGAKLKASNGITYKNPAFDVLNKAQMHLSRLSSQVSHLLDGVKPD